MSRKKQANRSSKLDHIPGLNYEEVKENIGTWIEHFLSVNHPVFNNLPPCPFAKKAWTDGAVEVIMCPQPKHFAKEKALLDKDKEVLVYVFDRVTLTPSLLSTIAEHFNKENPDLLALEDHPEDLELVQDVKMNHGCYALILVQRRDKINRAREMLAKKGYYDNWDEEYLKSVIQA